jgi:hypothetical protein
MSRNSFTGRGRATGNGNSVADRLVDSGDWIVSHTDSCTPHHGDSVFEFKDPSLTTTRYPSLVDPPPLHLRWQVRLLC